MEVFSQSDVMHNANHDCIKYNQNIIKYNFMEKPKKTLIKTEPKNKPLITEPVKPKKPLIKEPKKKPL